MDNDDPNDNQKPAPETAPATQSAAAPTIPLDQVRELVAAEVKKATDSVWAAARRKYEGKESESPKPQPKPEQATASAPAGLTEEVERMVARASEFARGVERHKLNPDQESILRTLLKVENPPDVGAWLVEKARAFGNPAPQPTQSAQPAPQAQSAAAAPPAQTPAAAPAGSSTPTSPVADKLFQPRDVMDAYKRSLNFNPHDRYSVPSRKAIRTLAEEGRRLMEAVRVLPPVEG